jgi:hypothetical protein
MLPPFCFPFAKPDRAGRPPAAAAAARPASLEITDYFGVVTVVL